VRHRWTAFVIAFGLVAGLAAQPASAQGGPWRKAGQGRVAGRNEKPNRGGGGGNNAHPNARPNPRAMEGMPPKWVENLRNMPPEEQERFMQNNERFKNLPPQRQEQIRRNLQKWNSLTPEQKEEAGRREQMLERMTPEQRDYVRNTLLPKWQAMPQDRRQAINRHLGMLSNMSPETQQAALNDPRFMQGLNPDEQSMLKELNSLRNPPPE
jgi:hypothetical protein